MKQIISISFLICFCSISILCQSQTAGFKTLTKSKASYHTSFTPLLINGQRQLKSGSINSKNSFSPGNALNAYIVPAKDKEVITGNDKRTPVFIKQKNLKLKSSELFSASEKCFEFLDRIKKDMQVENPSENFIITGISEDELGQQHIRLSQKYNGIRVYNSDFYVHFSSEFEIMNGKYSIIQPGINIRPQISVESALHSAKADLEKTTEIYSLPNDQRELLKYEGPHLDTVIFENPNNLTRFNLTYVVTIRPNIMDEWIYFIDAVNGRIVKKYNNTKFDGPATAIASDLNGISQSINTNLSGGKYYLMDISQTMYNASKNEGFILTLNAQNTSTVNLNYAYITSANNIWNNPTAISAQYNAQQTYKYFKNTYGRNSINGQGGNIISFINVTDKDGSSMANAFWNGAAIYYGNGGTIFKPLAGALDVAGHEIGHGVIGNTAALEYQGQSGAMNEAFADIFGSMVDRSNWYIGESVTNTSFISTGRLRDMSNPHNDNGNGWQPAHTSEMYTGDNDNGGVHTNSGIINYAYYLYATAVSKDTAEHIFYRSLTTYLNKSSQFLDLRLAVIQSATDLFGAGSNEVAQAKIAFDAVGIYEEQQIKPTQDYPENPGQGYLLVYNTDQADPNSLYKSTVDASSLTPLSATKMKRKPSIVDDGSGAVFVSTDNKLMAITLGSSPTESVISEDAVWDNAAISKDGGRIAGITYVIDTAIYVYDFNSANWAKFHLYNPTTQNNVQSGGALYADAIEWDHTGQYLIYDSYNVLYSVTGDSISYWDIGIIHVWDNLTNNFADGSISKLYGSLPENTSIGNPTFSKNSPFIIAFDFLNESTQEFAIYGLNLETMDLGLITNNNTIGFPSFSRLDDKISFGTLNSSSRPIIDDIVLNSDKISSSDVPLNIITEAEWPVYYAEGTRSLGVAPLANFTASYKSGYAPLTVSFTDISVNAPVSWEWTFVGGSPSTSTDQNPVVSYATQGIYTVSLKATNTYGDNTLTKSGYIVVSAPSGVEKVEDKLQYYPNPVTDFLNIINFKDQAGSPMIYIYSVEGRLVKQQTFDERVDVRGLEKGIYLVKIASATKNCLIKIIKE